MPAHTSSRTLCILLFLVFCFTAGNSSAQVTVLLPDQPTREINPKDKLRQMDVLLALITPFSYTALPMEMPQRVAVVRYVPPTVPEKTPPPDAESKTKTEQAPPKDYESQAEELLGDLEEIRYLGEKSWATHVALNVPGLYTLIAETRPRYNEERHIFEQDMVKTILPVYGVPKGWYAPTGLLFEIVPLTRPFGLMAPAQFNAKVLLGDNPLRDATVTAMRLNTSKRGLPSIWHEKLEVRTNSAGEFSLICPLEGWWCFVVSTTAGPPLKGPDDIATPLKLSAILWVYVDDAKNTNHKPLPQKGKK